MTPGKRPPLVRQINIEHGKVDYAVCYQLGKAVENLQRYKTPDGKVYWGKEIAFADKMYLVDCAGYVYKMKKGGCIYKNTPDIDIRKRTCCIECENSPYNFAIQINRGNIKPCGKIKEHFEIFELETRRVGKHINGILKEKKDLQSYKDCLFEAGECWKLLHLVNKYNVTSQTSDFGIDDGTLMDGQLFDFYLSTTFTSEGKEMSLVFEVDNTTLRKMIQEGVVDNTKERYFSASIVKSDPIKSIEEARECKVEIERILLEPDFYSIEDAFFGVSKQLDEFVFPDLPIVPELKA